MSNSVSNSTFQIERLTVDGKAVMRLSGVVDEHAELGPIADNPGAELWIDVGGIRRVNSFGVRLWVETMRAIPESVPMYFLCCSTAIIDQCNLVLGFLGHGHVVSFQAPLICEDCEEQQTQLFDTTQCLALEGRLPPTACPNCKLPMELDDFEEHYLYFLHKQIKDLPKPPY